jgi:3-oxoadipate enol-lactonase
MDLRDDLELIPVPTLVICGDSDPNTPVAKTREWVANIEGARLEVIRKAAHLVNVEQPQAFADLVLAFLLD